ncbi:CPBP family intramembrane glutamic endopeptidase [Bacillus sp. USDA818B3_A]|uniref:CPBP family intramembrane glutamic endopeptidase n=1 Tax=Bacillus sp. USDA818B3_A TaxID=2698834 RepID=UPI00136E445A|nr:type II CAAX endopeptidase family protein [Bacillus sp. USDA818B3_A]
MDKRILDIRLILGFIIAHGLIYFSFHDKTIFWYIFSGSILILIAFAMLQGEVDDEVSFGKYISLGILSGLMLYLLFWLGFHAFQFLDLPVEKSVKKLYRWYEPQAFWHYIALVLVAAPGEELFWRGFIQKSLLKNLKFIWGILLGAVLYSSVSIYSGSFLLVFASFIAGLAWGLLYYWKKSMPLVIVSHIIFDIMIFIILPFN